MPVYNIIYKKADIDPDDQGSIYMRGRVKFFEVMRDINETKKFSPKNRRKIQEVFIEMIDDHFDWYRTRNKPTDKQRGKQFDLEIMHFIKLELKGILNGETSGSITPTTKNKDRIEKE